MEGLNFLNFAKNAFSDLMRVVKKEIEEALTEENIKKVLKPLEKATKTVNKELDKYFEKPILKNKNQKLFPKNKNLEAMNEKELVKEIIKTENKEYAEEVFLCLRNKIKSKKAIVEFVMDDKRVFTYTFSEDFLEKVNKFLSGEEKHGKTYGSDAELYKIFTEKKVKKVKFIYIEEGKRDKGKFSKWYHSIDLLDLREIQIMRNETDLLIERDDLPNFIHKKLENDKTPTKEDIKKIRLNQRTEHCLVNSLKVLGASEEELAKARNYIGENSFRTKDLTPLGSLLNCFFKLTVISHDDKSGQSKQFNKKSKELIPNIKTYHLVLYDGHYMPNIIHDVTAYAINNYERVKNFENWNRVKYIQKKNGREVAQRVKKCETDTIKVINALHDSKRFYWNDTIHEKTEHRHELILTEKTVNECQAKLKIIKPKKVNEDYIFDADFESLVSGVERHIPFMLGCVSQKGDYKKVYLADKENLEKNHIFERMLDDIIKVYGEKIDKENDLTKGKEITDLIEFKQNKTKEEQIISHKTNNNTRNTLYNRKKKNFIIYFHNLKYDYSLIQAAKFVNISNVCEKQGQLYSATIVFRGYVFELRDSYKMISLPLKDFKSSLDLESGKKDFSLYEYFTTDNFTNKLARIEDLQKFDKKMTVEKMRKRNMEKFLVEIKGGTFVKILDFYIDYMLADCETMREGLEKFNTLMKEQTGLKCFEFLTISSLANCYISNKCYQGTYKVSGELRRFLTLANFGGRVTLQGNVRQNRLPKKLKEYIKNVELQKNETNEIEMEKRKNLMTAFKKKVKKIQDFDGVSLYPSAMKISEIPLGKCRLIKKEIIVGLNKMIKERIEKIGYLDKIEIDRNVSHYVVEVRLKLERLGKGLSQQIPMISEEDDEGVRQWTNNPNKAFINKIELEKLVDYYKVVELEFVQGVVWGYDLDKKDMFYKDLVEKGIEELKKGLEKLRDMPQNDLVRAKQVKAERFLENAHYIRENVNKSTAIQDVIEELFNARLEAKKAKNKGLDVLLKLFMNSAYGKTNVKPSKSEIRYIRMSYKEKFIQNNYEFIKHMIVLEDTGSKYDRIKVKLRSHTHCHSNLAHIAGIYLANSKVIVNDILNVFTKLGKQVLYTDTDSLHVYQNDIAKVSEKYKELYGRDLVGKQLGQFHDDFEPYIPKFDKNVKIEKNKRRAYPQYSIGFIGLAKKVYMDVLANDFDDNINYHIRFKGANEANIKAYCQTQKITLVEFYEKLYKGDKVRLNLCAGKTRFDYDEKGRVFTKTKFDRCFQFA